MWLVAAGGIVVVFEDEIPAIEAILAPVRHHIAAQPDPVLAGRGQEKAAAATVDADDLGGRLEHIISMPPQWSP